MKSLEDILRPSDQAPSGNLRDALVWAMLAGLILAMLPAWWVDKNLLLNLWGGSANELSDVVEVFSRRMLSFLLLPTLGFMLALRCGAVDLSVWVVGALAALVTAWMLIPDLNATGPAPSIVLAILAGLGVGLACGLFTGILVSILRLPSLIVSGLMAFGLFSARRWFAPNGTIVLENDALDGFLKGFQNIANHMGFPEVTLQSTAILFVFVIYAFTMLVLVIINNATVDQYPPKHIPKRLGLFVSLVASGLLSAAGGVIGLIEYGQAPVPCRPVGDLVIPAAALLAGGLYLAGPKRTLLVCLLLPASLAVASAWRQDVLSLRSDYLPGFPLQVGVLIVMVAMSRYAMTGASKTSNRRDLALVMAWLSSLGIVVFAACVWFDSPTIRTIAHLLGAGFWLVGAVGAISLRFLPKRRSAW